jgi:hypothetical protein
MVAEPSVASEAPHEYSPPPVRIQGDLGDILTFYQEGPAAGHLALDIRGRATVPPTVPGPGSQQAEVMGSSIFINLNDTFLPPYRDAFQEPGHFRLWDS